MLAEWQPIKAEYKWQYEAFPRPTVGGLGIPRTYRDTHQHQPGLSVNLISCFMPSNRFYSILLVFISFFLGCHPLYKICCPTYRRILLHFGASENDLYVRTCIPLFSILVNEDLCVVCVFNYVHISCCNPWLSLPQSGNPRLTPCQIQTMPPHPRSLVTSNSGWRWRWFVMELEWKEQQLMGCLITR